MYATFNGGELDYWNSLSKSLKSKGFQLFLLAPRLPDKYYHFSCEIFIEKLDNIPLRKVGNEIDHFSDLDKYLNREAVWYGNGGKDRETAVKLKIEKYDKILNELNPCYVLVSNGQHASELVFIDQIKRKKIPYGFFERGCLPNSWHFDDYGITAGTTIAKKKINQLKLPVQTTSFRKYKDSYLNKLETWWEQPNLNILNNIRRKHKISSSTKLILFVNQLDNDTSNFLYSPFFKSNLEAFKWFLNELLDIECFVLVKKHPKYLGSGEEFIHALNNSQLRGAWVEDISLFDCINQCDYLCAVNSTVIYEGLIFDKPVLQLGQSILSNKDIVYELKSLEDRKIILSWLKFEELNNRIDNFHKFMSYMIENELSFFSPIDTEFNGHKLFLNIILNRLDFNRNGTKNLSFGKKYIRQQKTHILLKIIKKLKFYS